MTVHVHLVRHGEIASHQGDVPLTESGLKEVQDEGRKMGENLTENEKLFFLYASTNRTRQTAEKFQKGILESVEKYQLKNIAVHEPVTETAIRNPDIFLGGLRVEMVSSAKALSEQTYSVGLKASHLETVPFWPDFWKSPDRIGYWLGLVNPPGENANAVARRIMTFASSLNSLPIKGSHRYVCVTHSPVLRAFLNRFLLEEDPGEPEYCESIDLYFKDENTCTIRFRKVEKTISI